MTEPSAWLVVNADDFGIDPAVNAGILHCHRQGMVTSTSLMAVGHAFDEAVVLARQTPQLDIGVHLTLVAERPLLAQPALVTEDGCFPASVGQLARRLLRGKLPLAAVRAEWSAQIDKVLAAGIQPSHLDSHQHVHLLPGLAPLAWQLAAEYGIAPVRLPLEHPPGCFPENLAAIRRLGGLGAVWISWWLARMLSSRWTVGNTSTFLGFLAGGQLQRERLAALLAQIVPGGHYELMCHPGFAPQDATIQRWSYHHQLELEALTDQGLLAMLEERRIRLCRFRDLPPVLPR